MLSFNSALNNSRFFPPSSSKKQTKTFVIHTHGAFPNISTIKHHTLLFDYLIWISIYIAFICSCKVFSYIFSPTL